MTKEQANEIKKALKKEDLHYQTYFHKKNKTLKVILINERFQDNNTKELYTNKILEVLNALTKNGLRPKYKIQKITTRNSYYEYNQYSLLFE